MWYLVGLVWIALMVGIITAYTRKQRRRASERAQHMEKMLAELKANPRALADAADTVTAPAAAAPVPQFSRKPRLLPQPVALLYYVFRAGLPDHEIFAGVALDDLLEVGTQAHAGQREQLLHKLSQQRRLDLVVCTRQLEVVAAVVVSGPVAGAADDSAQFASQCLQSAGVRVVRVDPAAPPRHHQVHALVYG
jgi:hypothetical protein